MLPVVFLMQLSQLYLFKYTEALQKKTDAQSQYLDPRTQSDLKYFLTDFEIKQ